MVSSPKSKIVVDSVHGDIRPNETEWKIIDTPSFQRLRKLKQLQMAYLVYPNATHTRFAHSIGVLRVMERILDRVDGDINNQDTKDLRLAALLHDVGHYPYSHLLEGVDNVVLTEEFLNKNKKEAFDSFLPYPSHEEVGQAILQQKDISNILGEDRASRIGRLFAGTEVTDPQLSKLIHSSLDMDRLDYLIRDSQATGVPYGLVDIHYLLNHIKRGSDGTIGISHKAIAAAEHLLLARSFLFRVVCQHKTVFGFEEVARQLLRRLRDRAQKGGEGYGIPKDGNEIIEIAKGDRLFSFADSFLDTIFVKAAQEDTDELIQLLARCIVSRRPPRLIWEKRVFEDRNDSHNWKEVFRLRCQANLENIAEKYNLHLGQFLICELKPIGFESRGALVSKDDVEKEMDAGEIEMIQVFPDPASQKPIGIVDMPHSVLHEIGGHAFQTYRLYIVHPEDDQDDVVAKLKEELKDWQ